MAAIIDRCLKKNRDDRFASSKELLAALERVADEKGKMTLVEAESPFAGLSAFQEADAARFFGRDADITAVLTKLRHHELIAVTGPSGAGKSSFVRAGILPALKQSGKPYETWAIRPGRQPLVALAEALAILTDTDVGGDAAEEPQAITEILRAQPGYLGLKLRARCRKGGIEKRIVLFVDQFEELYTLGADATERAAFCACLEGVADDASSPLRVIVAIRADFLDRLTENRHFLAAVTRGLVFLPPMGPDGLRDALTRPLEMVQYAFEDAALVDEMLMGLSLTKSPLPILQFTMTKWWDTRDRKGQLLTRDAYQRLGGVAGALSTHADAVLASLSKFEQRLVRAIFLRLVTADRTRAIVGVDELRSLSDDAAAVDQVITHLVEARLLAIESSDDGDEKTVELTHESLIESWGKLRSWLDANEQHAQFLAELRNAAHQWEKNGEAEGLLWRDHAALEAGQWLMRSRMDHGADATIELGKREQRYLEAVVHLAERTRQRRQQFTAVVIAAILVFAVVVLVLAIRARDQAQRADVQAQRADEQAKRADERANDAEEGARRARNATRMAAARGLEEDPTTMLAVLREMEVGPLLPGWDALVRRARGRGIAEVVMFNGSHAGMAAFSPDGRHIAMASGDAIVRIWNADLSGLPVKLYGHKVVVRGIAWSPDGTRIVSSDRERTIVIQNADGTGEPFVLHRPKGVSVVAWSRNGQVIAAASEDNVVHVWNADGTGERLVCQGEPAWVHALEFSPDGKHLLSSSDNHVVQICNVNGVGEVHRIPDCSNASYSADGQHILLTSKLDHSLQVRRIDGTGTLVVLRGHERDGKSLFTHDGKHIVSASYDGTLRVWNADGTGKPTIFLGHGDKILDVDCNRDNRHCVSVAANETVRLWRIQGPELWRVLHGHDDAVGGVAYSPDGQHIMSASVDNTVRIWNADGSAQSRVFRGHTGAVNSARYSADGRRFVTASADMTVRIWNADGHGDPIVLRGHTGEVHSATFSADGRHIVSASADKTVRVWNADGSGESTVLRGHEHIVHGAAFSPDNRHVASASHDRTIRIWNLVGTDEPLVLRGHTGGIVGGVAYSPDGKHIVTAARDKTVRIWNADGTGEPVILRGHEAMALVDGDKPFSPDGKRVISSSDDGTVRIWNVDGTGEPVLLRLSDKPVNSASFGPDGQSIVAGLDDHTLMVVTELDPYTSAADPRLWAMTSYCMPLEVRKALLGFSDEQSREDLEHCQQKVAKAHDSVPTPN